VFIKYRLSDWPIFIEKWKDALRSDPLIEWYNVKSYIVTVQETGVNDGHRPPLDVTVVCISFKLNEYVIIYRLICLGNK